MIYSLNEIEALARKAARGGGMSWGLAEETGKAVRWLSENGLPGPRLLVDLLRLNDGTAYADLAPRQADGIWRARSGLLCPIIAGALICDRADELTAGEGLRLGEVAVPLLLAPFASAAARSAGVAVALEWRGVSLLLDGGTLKADGNEAALLATRTETAGLFQTDAGASRPVRTGTGRHVTFETLNALESFALRTCAPATEASRAGAGARQETD
ncbi:DUF3726 domain-containing protein [Cribrihabitans pelagius]|uniref:DUF3726 domain-containing protein n=1 Tax=Cribrihabitans pelagius TaxID=1765746 RepID=UPI003B5CC026